MRTRLACLMSCLLLAGLLLAASAAAEVRSGSAADPVEGGKPPGRDLTAVSASYDTAGTIQVVFQTVGEPENTAEMEFTAVFGTLSGSECVEPKAAIVGSYQRPPDAGWGFAGSEGPATETIVGNQTTLVATSPVLANQAFNCVMPVLYKVEGGELGEPYEGLVVPIQLVGPPPPPPPPASAPAPSSPPSSSPPPSAPAPPPAPAPKVASLTFPSQTVLLHRNTWKKVKVKVTNTGTIATGKPVLKIGKAKGVVVKPKSGKLKLKPIAPGKTRVASFSVALTRKAKIPSKLTLRLSAGKGVKASGLLTLEIPRKVKKKQGGKTGKKEEIEASGSLAEKIFYGYETQATESAKLIGYAFIDSEWAYHGIPTEGLPSCTSETGSATADGCVKYKFDPKTNAVQIGSLTGTIGSSGQLEINQETYSATSIPAAGERLQVEQEYIGYSGLCGLITGCSTFHEHLVLTSSGEFVLNHESLTTAGGSGPGETFVAAGSYSPDEHGTYAVEKGARIKLTFADGTTQTKTFAVFLNTTGQPDATYAGLLLGDKYFTFAHAS